MAQTILRQAGRWLHPIDKSGAVGRARDRHKRVAWSASASALSKVVSVSTALISVPLTLEYLGIERYGMWVTMSSLIATFSFADLGIGNGILNVVASAHGRDDRTAIQRTISSGLVILTLLGITFLTLFTIAYTLIPWAQVFNVHTEIARKEAGPALAVLVACFSLNIPLAIIQRVQLGLQQGFIASLWQCLGSILGLCGVLLTILFEGGLPWLVLAYVGAPLIATLLNGVFFLRSDNDLLPTRRGFSRQSARQIARTGILFLVLQLTVTLVYTSDNIIISQILGAAAVADYAVLDKMFGIITVFSSILLMPLWPAYGEAIARGDQVWVRTTLIRSLGAATMLTTFSALLLILNFRSLTAIWVGNLIDPPLLLVIGFGIWRVIQSAASAVAVFLNGANIIKFQVIIATCTTLAGLFLKINLVLSFGVAGAVWASIIAYVLFSAIPLIFYLSCQLRSLLPSSADAER